MFELRAPFAGDRDDMDLVAALCKPAGDLIGMGRPAEIAGDWDATRDVENLHGLHALVALEVEDDTQRPFGNG